MSAGKRKQWQSDEQSDDMRKAIEDVRSNRLGYLFAKRYNVPRAILHRLCNKEGSPDTVSSTTLGRKTALPPELETELVKYLLIMDQMYYGLTRKDLRSMAFQLARRNSLPHPFSFLRESAGKDWLYGFMKRHKASLSIRKPTGTSLNRALGFNKEDVNEFFNLLEKLMTEKDFHCDRFYNVDETGLCIVQSKCPEVVSKRGKLTTGGFVPPMIIFPRKNSSEQLKKGAPPGTSGWIQTEIFTKWFDHFLERTNPTKDSPVLLILDGHHTHTRNIDVVIKARENFVTILCLPPHTSHKMQPLDKTFMGALKTFYNEEVRLFMRAHNRAVTHFDMGELFGRAYTKVQTAERSIKGFSTTGIYPFRRDVFSDEDFLAEQQRHHVPHPVTADFPENNEPALCHSPNILPKDIAPILQLKKKIGSRGRKPGRARVVTSTPNKEELEECINRSREKVTKRLINEAGPSSFKQSAKKKRKARSPSTSPSSLTSSSELVPANSSDEDDLPLSSYISPKQCADYTTECIFCQEMFTMSKSREVWVKCVICNGWAHEACTSCEGDIYICGFCK
ncbi:unnamed protein product [Acanthoscelides obtectus]|uniref:HTH CENPB-type domain-containing protein n=1 Tax=Acanthoscelides obtectus TaxID=200917 RepID=A0A9P0PT17_ACAOB|nr:unnamed protein product [Acanthoscelides obtectus]CAK1643849.1 hypothetical protein AOBTE_LOCUS13701 [Acanthoscelides obtectus]